MTTREATAKFIMKHYLVKQIEPGIIEYRCKTCSSGFESDTTASELLQHSVKHLVATLERIKLSTQKNG